MLPEFRRPEPVPKSPRGAAFGHAANIGGGSYYADAASAMRRKELGYFQRAASKQAAPLTTTRRAMQKAPRYSRASKDTRQGMQAGHVPAHEGSRPVAGIEQRRKAKQSAPSLQAGASDGSPESILGDAECLQSKAKLPSLARHHASRHFLQLRPSSSYIRCTLHGLFQVSKRPLKSLQELELVVDADTGS